MLRATRACTFWTSQIPKLLRTWGVFDIFWHVCFEMCFAHLRATMACNFYQFLISHLPRWPTFRPSGATKLCKTQLFAFFVQFFFWLFLFSDLLSSSLLFSESSHLCFFINIVGSLTSKLLRLIYNYRHPWSGIPFFTAWVMRSGLFDCEQKVSVVHGHITRIKDISAGLDIWKHTVYLNTGVLKHGTWKYPILYMEVVIGKSSTKGGFFLPWLPCPI